MSVSSAGFSVCFGQAGPRFGLPAADEVVLYDPESLTGTLEIVSCLER
jgi:hypothetical protein